jgi:TM2 domain-containing membrane protein YozV
MNNGNTRKLTSGYGPLFSFIWPGLGQLYQGRIGAGLMFIAVSVIMIVVFFAYPPFRGMASVAMAVLATASVLEAFRTQRTDAQNYSAV